jgi:hypothetical protein
LRLKPQLIGCEKSSLYGTRVIMLCHKVVFTMNK